VRSILQFAELIEHYIEFRQDNGEQAEALSDEKVRAAKTLYIAQVKELIGLLAADTNFHARPADTLAETRARVPRLKHVIENEDGYRPFFADGKPIRRESDLQTMFTLTWNDTTQDVNRELNNGRGPVDFAI
jgi:hypothetical protein